MTGRRQQAQRRYTRCMETTLREPDQPGLERSCAGPEWVHGRGPVDGVEVLRARLHQTAFNPHRHDTYGIGVTETGVQRFTYRGTVYDSLPGQVLVLHPDEAHDGRTGTGAGFGYRIVYVHPARVGDALEAVIGRNVPLPFVTDAVGTHRGLAAAVAAASRWDLEPLAIDSLVVRIAQGLIEAARAPQADRVRIDSAAVERGRGYLDAALRVVRREELERVTGLSRYDFARQFRARYGTSPYRYSLLRRLEHARHALLTGATLADAALTASFADQAHFTRLFKAAYGMPPGRYGRLAAAAPAA